MTLSWAIAALHLLGLAIGLGSVWARGEALRGDLSPAGLRRVFAADNWWGVSGLLLIGTGLYRLLAELDKSTEYYFRNHLFVAKMGCLALVLALEIPPMVTLIRWRVAHSRGEVADPTRAPQLAVVSRAQAVLLVLMILAASGMARGQGLLTR